MIREQIFLTDLTLQLHSIETLEPRGSQGSVGFGFCFCITVCGHLIYQQRNSNKWIFPEVK